MYEKKRLSIKSRRSLIERELVSEGQQELGFTFRYHHKIQNTQ